jgi:hypothetical protein
MEIKDKERVIKIGKCLDEEEKEDTTTFLHDFPKIFSWTYIDMPRIDPKIVTHDIVLVENTKPVKKKIQKMKPKIDLLVGDKIEKLLDIAS